MSIRTVLILGLALVSGLSAAVGVNALRQPMINEGPEMVSIVVAVVDIPRFTTVTPDMVTTQSYPKDFVPSGTLTSVDDAVNRVVYAPLMKDDPVLERKLASKGIGRGMAASLPDGMQAFTISATTVSSSVGGFILPGNKVDVLLTVTNGLGRDDRTGGGYSKPLVESVEVLAVNQRLDAPAENKVNPKELHSVTLLVTPRQVHLLSLGQQSGVLHLALRNPNDSKPTSIEGVTMDDIRMALGDPVDDKASKPVAAAEPPPPPPVPTQIRTLRGNQESVILIYATPTPYSGR